MATLKDNQLFWRSFSKDFSLTQKWLKSKDENGQTPAHWAAQEKNFAALECFLKIDHYVLKLSDPEGWTPWDLLDGQSRVIVSTILRNLTTKRTSIPSTAVSQRKEEKQPTI